MFDNHLPELVFSVSDFPLPIKSVCMFIDGREFAVQKIRRK